MRTLGKVAAMLMTLFGFVCSLAVMSHEFGLAGAIIAFILAPLSTAVVPWYVLLRYGSPMLLIITYVGFVLFALVDREREQPYTSIVAPARHAR